MKADSWFREHMGEFGGEIRFDEALARHTYYRIGGPARWVLIPASIEDLQWIRRGLQAEGCAWFILGLGSNILASDIGFAGAVIKTSRLGPQKMEEIDSGRLRTGAGVAISSLLRRASSSGWGGLEFLAGIPGSVGGVVRMNAGTHLGEAKDAIVKVEAYDLNGADADLGLTYED
ncbi:MAG: FAD-binding protein, partial [Bdellovibrionota bacterium]